jgi:hypothetical protein
LLEFQRLRRSGTNVNDYRGSVSVVGSWAHSRAFPDANLLQIPGWARLFGISRIRTSGTNVNDYRGSVGIAGYLCVPRRCRPRVAVSAMPQCEDIGRHPCSHVGAEFRMVGGVLAACCDLRRLRSAAPCVVAARAETASSSAPAASRCAAWRYVFGNPNLRAISEVLRVRGGWW